MPFWDTMARIVNSDVVDQLKKGQRIIGRPDTNLLSQWDYAIEQIQAASLNQSGNGADVHDRSVAPIVRGARALGDILEQTGSLDLVNAIRGNGVSPQLAQKLEALSGKDLIASDIGRAVQVYDLLIKLLADSEAQRLRRHKHDFVEGVAAAQNLLKAQIESVFHHLLSKTEPRDPEAVEFFHTSSDSPKDLTSVTLSVGVEHAAEGGYARVYRTRLLKGPDKSEEVAVKVFKLTERTGEEGKQKINQSIRDEVMIWKKLRHRNIVPLLGLTHGFHGSPFASPVCPWMEHGTLHNYLENSKGELTQGDRLKLASDVLYGLSYLHNMKSVIHRDLSSNNVLIDSQRIARISDYGMSRVLSQFPDRVTTRVAGTSLWAAPELVTFDDSEDKGSPPITKACDIYSVGCIIFEIFANRLPYSGMRKETVELKKGQGEGFARVDESEAPFLTDDVWDVVAKCTRHDANARPDVTQVTEAVENIDVID